MSTLLIISIVESIYLIYMFHYFKTSTDFNILPAGFLAKRSDWFKHIIGNEYGLRICPFGQIAVIALVIVLLLRNFMHFSPFTLRASLGLSFLLALMNLNAVAYLAPVWITECYIANRETKTDED